MYYYLIKHNGYIEKLNSISSLKIVLNWLIEYHGIGYINKIKVIRKKVK